MILPHFRPFLGAAVSLVLGTGAAVAANPPAAEPAAAPQAKPGWLERVATAPKKLAFWEKDKNKEKAQQPVTPPAAPADPRRAPAKKASKTAMPAEPPKTAPDPAPAKPAASTKRTGAPPADAAPADAAPAGAEPAKESFFSRFHVLPFGKKPEAESQPPPPPPPATQNTKETAGRAGTRQQPKTTDTPDPAPAVDEKKAGFFDLTRLWSGKPDKSEPAPPDAKPAAPEPARTAARKERTAPAHANPGPAPVDPAPPAAKPSLWERMTAAVTPGARGGEATPAKPQTKPIPKGLAALGVTEPDANTYVITKDESPFFTYGPQQATPPDAYLRTGTIVTLTNKSWGWATVQLTDGRAGMVDRSALRPALITDLIPSHRPGDPLMAALSPNQLQGRKSPSFILPAAEMPDLPTGSDFPGPAGNPLLLPFSPDDITDPGDFPAFPEIPPLPEPVLSPPSPPASEPAEPDNQPPAADTPALPD